MTTIQSILYRLTEAVSGTDKELYTEDELNKFASFYLDKWDENTSENVNCRVFHRFLVEHRQNLQKVLCLRQANA